MSIDMLRPLLYSWQDSVIGFRSGQVGRANTGFGALSQILSTLLERSPAETRQAALPVLQKMLSAKERDDGITLADTIEHELPAVIATADPSARLLDLKIIADLRTLDGLPLDTSELDLLAQAVRESYEASPQAVGIAFFPAKRLFQAKRYDDARRILSIDEGLDRMTPAGAYLHGLLLAIEGKIDEATEEMSRAYAGSNWLIDGFIRISALMDELKQEDHALDTARQDELRDRLSVRQRIDLAMLYGRNARMKQAAQQVDAAYREDQALRDGYSRLGWIDANQRRWEAANSLLLKDRRAGRMTLPWKKHLAVVQMYLRHTEFALEIVGEIYAEDPGATDIFCQLGWHGYLLGKGKSFMREQIEKDRRLNRHAITGQLHEHMLHAPKAETDGAIRTISAAYEADPARRNWYALLGWAYFLEGEPELAYHLMHRDYRSGRMDALWMPTFAYIAKRTGRIAQVEDVLAAILDHGSHPVSHVIGFWTRPYRVVDTENLRQILLA